MIKVPWIFLFALIVFKSQAQSFAPEPGVQGSTAIHKDSSIIVDWASELSISRGYMNILNPGAGFASYGIEEDAIGMANGINVISFGDGGEAIVSFDRAIMNGPGPDFVIFENGFIDHYMEFAFVEVSSDGVSFYQFDAVSETPTDQQLSNFSISDCRYVNNLAGKYRQNFGTPFDLEELSGEIGLDVNDINFIRLIDVVGSIDSLVGSFDSQGNLINDPFPSEYESGGFYLDGVGVINQAPLGVIDQKLAVQVSPNPFSDKVNIKMNGDYRYSIVDCSGVIILKDEELNNCVLELSWLKSGIYFLHLESNLGSSTVRLVKK